MINPYVGEVTCFGFKRELEGWIKCEGQLLSVQEFKQLFSVVGKLYGGDGKTTFGLPNCPPITEDGGEFRISAVGALPTGGRSALPGEMTIFPLNVEPPPPWIICSGQLLQIAPQYATLFKILGTAFGGNGTTTFGVPNSRLLPPFSALLYSIANAPSGSTDQGFVSEIKIFPSTVPPNGWLPCNGRLLPIKGNAALFSLLGTDYGGDGQTNFGLPSVTRLPAGLQGFICQLGDYPPPP